MLKVGIVGASGYAGEELNKILSRHRKVKIVSLSATYARKEAGIEAFDLNRTISSCELVFFALPQAQSMRFVPKVLEAGKKVIDLGADYRLKNIREYKFWYNAGHIDQKNLKYSIYGLPEIYKDKIKKAKLVANPGCYPTAAILSLAPLLNKKLIKSAPIVIDAKSGLSGAGRKAVEGGLSDELKNNFRPYKINYHQHMPEINQELSFICKKKVSVNFVPHLLPLFRGLLTTTYVKLLPKSSLSQDKIIKIYRQFYKDQPFIRIAGQGETPQVTDVAGTNFCKIGIFWKNKSGMLVIVSAIDNLLKGAAGQAVQNMNLIYGFGETEGLL
ncbi:MAG: N-acetyl-gamma-glutamyl-phosphate reductase [Candidatus Omnitrophica bacterium CG11_big_fil_rev_8_21_14_0_20_42_13]|uniref:N-acetyl-gamma-glutamyl-phosphate reductase n=1 Tax=Candidatus Ghiorseimicrobium undicola TaxID=1974746 RepID=A0A2H0LYA4_9BACT|nr:MAG: N-acetyl-gamma-glutamyl-phosphate reductase [Candidatus Omnitrophica bacterium CG11_big_fil_rev_8_21_14_0_20_42_13]